MKSFNIKLSFRSATLVIICSFIFFFLFLSFVSYNLWVADVLWVMLSPVSFIVMVFSNLAWGALMLWPFVIVLLIAILVVFLIQKRADKHIDTQRRRIPYIDGKSMSWGVIISFVIAGIFPEQYPHDGLGFFFNAVNTVIVFFASLIFILVATYCIRRFWKLKSK